MKKNYSVVVPYRDKYDLFVKAVESIPDREDIQIIIVDNAPQPLQEELIPKKDVAHIKYTISSPIKGAGCARNEGLRHIEGKYILFLDADDYFTPEAFPAFDKYLGSENDIIFFKPTSIKLSDGSPSNRQSDWIEKIDNWFATGDERPLRYRWGGPVCKMFRTEFIKQGGWQFEELPVNNDAWFSLMAGHHANKIAADKTVVYVITEGEAGQSLVKKVTRENAFIRFDTAIRENKFMKSVGRYDMHIRLLGFIRIAWKNFGLKEALKYLKYAYDNKVGIF